MEIDLAQRDSIRTFVKEHQNCLVGVFLLSLKEVFMYHSQLEDMMSEASPHFSAILQQMQYPVSVLL